jgi:hypothetical protein
LTDNLGETWRINGHERTLPGFPGIDSNRQAVAIESGRANRRSKRRPFFWLLFEGWRYESLLERPLIDEHPLVNRRQPEPKELSCVAT